MLLGTPAVWQLQAAAPSDARRRPLRTRPPPSLDQFVPGTPAAILAVARFGFTVAPRLPARSV